MRSIIVGTAGHIDHGKTSLVHALTGTNADRLPEEQRRGITIDLGFAELALENDGVRLGFVDVPGHERFVKNMLAGAHGIDLVCLVIAADEGVMPQTREHFDICRLLGIRSGVVCLTKTDTVDEDLLALVRMEVEELVADSFLESAPVVAVSARTGNRIDELKRVLGEVARLVPERASYTVARLPVDRAFSLRGFGAIVTGTLVAGEIGADAEMELLPAGRRVRVRGVQVHGQRVERARAGERTAVNLGGVEAAQIARGDVLAPTNRLQATQILDARIDVLAGAARALRSRARVRVHAGAAEVLARVSVLEETGEIATGASGFAQLRLESPIVALPGERFILRSYSPSHTIAGGIVLDALARKYRGRERAAAHQRLASLAELSSKSGESGELDGENFGTRLALYVAAAGEHGLTRVEQAARTGWTDEVLSAAATAASRSDAVIDAGGTLISRATFDRLLESCVRAVEAHHKREPLARGLGRETLREQVFTHAPIEIFKAVLARAEASGKLVSERDIVRAATHSLELHGADAELQTKLESIYREARLEAPGTDEAIARAGIKPGAPRAQIEHARRLLRLLTERGTLVRVGEDLILHRDALDEIKAKLRAYADAHEPRRVIDVATFKNLAGVSRKYAIPILEFFDRTRVTRREEDGRAIL